MIDRLYVDFGSFGLARSPSEPAQAEGVEAREEVIDLRDELRNHRVVDRTAEFSSLARRLRATGSDVDATLGRLRASGATIVECVKVVREVEAVPLHVAKEIVDSSRAWGDRLECNVELRLQAIEALEDDASGHDP